MNETGHERRGERKWSYGESVYAQGISQVLGCSAPQMAVKGLDEVHCFTNLGNAGSIPEPL